MKTEPLQELLNSEMDRKEFLAYMGATLLAVFGISGLMKALMRPTQSSATGSGKANGYGGSSYGK